VFTLSLHCTFPGAERTFWEYAWCARMLNWAGRVVASRTPRKREDYVN